MVVGLARSVVAAILCIVGLSGCAQRHIAQPTPIPPSPCGPYSPHYAASLDGHGCATAIILQSMLADPTDLVNPDPLPLPYGDAAIAPAQRHREGRVKMPSTDYGTSNAPTSSGEAPQ